MLTLTIVMKNSGTILDIMVKPEQRIRDVLLVLSENRKIIAQETDDLYLRSWRLGTMISALLTFKQAGIQTGDILYIEVEAHEDK